MPHTISSLAEYAQLIYGNQSSSNTFSDASTGAYCAMYWNVVHNEQVFAMRGTDDVRDALVDIMRWPTPGHGPYKLHAGFMLQANSLMQYVANNIASGPTCRPIYMTGHSLGGALATIIASVLAPLHPTREVYAVTFGAPRVGNANYKRYCDSIPNLHIMRVTHTCDIIPRIPTFGYVHVGVAVQIKPVKFTLNPFSHHRMSTYRQSTQKFNQLVPGDPDRRTPVAPRL